MLRIIDGSALSADRVALLDDRSLAPSSPDRAKIDRLLSRAAEHTYAYTASQKNTTLDISSYICRTIIDIQHSYTPVDLHNSNDSI